MKRREFIAGLGAAAWPWGVRAQQSGMPVVGFLDNSSPNRSFQAAFVHGLGVGSYYEGRNVAVEYRWAEGRNERLSEMAADLVHRQVAAIACFNTPSVLAAKAATNTVPIVFALGIDPVEAGLVASLNRPGGNLTGVTQLSVEVAAKRFELLHELVPAVPLVAILVNPTNVLFTEAETREARNAARALRLGLAILPAKDPSSIETAFASLAEKRAGAVLVSPDSLFVTQRELVVALAAKYSVPAMYHRREFTATGGLMSYGPSLAEAYRQVGVYISRILSGEQPADLPVQQSTRIDLVINMKTARMLGLAVPESILVRADEVIE
jgi:putative ABC transport system substrate-binding protein